MILKPLFYIKVVQVMVKKKISTSKTWVGVSSNRPGQVTPRPGQVTPTLVPISFFFSDTDNKFTGLIL